jgi:hypothetical protein
MGNILKIVRSDAIRVARGCDGRDFHPVSAMLAGKQQARQKRGGNVLEFHGTLTFRVPQTQLRPISRPIRRRVKEYMCAAPYFALVSTSLASIVFISRAAAHHAVYRMVEVPSVALAVEGGAGGVAPGWRITFQVEVEPMF